MRQLSVLVACEFSGIVRSEFEKRGWNAWSCDLLETEIPGNHYRGSAEDIVSNYFDLMICPPPCTHLAVSGARHFPEKSASGVQQQALDFVSYLLNADVKYIALENPVSIISTKIRKPSQYIQPWQFGHGETKKTGLWLKNLSLLTPTNVVEGRLDRVHKLPPGPNRAKDRSRTYSGIAKAMADQWGSYIENKELNARN